MTLSSQASPHPLPVGHLLLLACAGFITILTEALPAGLLPAIAADMSTSTFYIGQWITAYALGSLLAAIPLVRATRHWPRKRLLLIAFGGFAAVNLVTAWSSINELTLIARFVAGAFAGLSWALLAGYAARLVPDSHKGRAITIAMLGAPLALSIGIPVGTWIGHSIGWRITFAGLSGCALLLLLAALRWLPAVQTGDAGKGPSLKAVLKMPGIAAILLFTGALVLAHNLLYTYIAPFLTDSTGLAADAGAIPVERILMIFGFSAIAGIVATGIWIDRYLRQLSLLVALAFIVSAFAMANAGSSFTLYAAVILWGIAFGAIPSLCQTASAVNAGSAADTAQALIVTVWNLAMAAGGLFGGLALAFSGSSSLAWSMLLASVPALLVMLSRERAFFRARLA